MRKGFFASILFIFTSVPAFASTTECPQFFEGGQAPDIINQSMIPNTIPLCNDAYSTLYSGIALAPLYSADVLTRESVQQGRGSGRHGTFHADDRLPEQFRLTPNDYKNPPGKFYDRGHMVPNSDMPTAELQEQTFLMSNMIVQSADNNEVLHEGIEATTRNLAEQVGKLYSVTGPIFYGSTLNRLNGHALIPTMIFKGISIPGQGASVYVEDNQPGQAYSVITVNQLKQLAGIDIFPALSEQEKNTLINLPEPSPGPMNRKSRESKVLGLIYQTPYKVSVQQLISDIGKVENSESFSFSGVENAVKHEFKEEAGRYLRDYIHRNF